MARSGEGAENNVRNLLHHVSVVVLVGPGPDDLRQGLCFER